MMTSQGALGGTTLIDYVAQPEFRRILDRVVTRTQDRARKSIAITSLQPGEGKSFVTAALAIGLTLFLKRRVLIIDTVSSSRDQSAFRVIATPNAGTTEGPSNIPGTIDLFLTKTFRNTSLSASSGGGGSFPLQGATDFQIAAFVSALSPSYDAILIDTCAIDAASSSEMDPILVGVQAGNALLIVGENKHSKEQLEELRGTVSSLGDSVIGMILNKGGSSRAR